MKVVFGADDTGETVDAVLDHLNSLGHSVDVVPRGSWPDVSLSVAEAVSGGKAEMGVLMCWTGTGSSMMANKVNGVRAAACWEPWIAQGARRWNDANVLVLSLKRTSPEEARAVLDAWFSVNEPDHDEVANIRKLSDYESAR